MRGLIHLPAVIHPRRNPPGRQDQALAQVEEDKRRVQSGLAGQQEQARLQLHRIEAYHQEWRQQWEQQWRQGMERLEGKCAEHVVQVVARQKQCSVGYQAAC